jgi:hypothetical protein
MGMEDKLLQMATKRISETIYEADFPDCFYGSRLDREPMDAVKILIDTLRLGNVTYL